MADKYYYADGRKIPLEVSDRFMAVRADEGARGRLGAMAARASSTMAPVQVHDVPEYGLSVLILPNGGTPAAARGAAREALSAMVGAERSLSEGPEVLEPEGAGGMAVIPVGEVIVKFKPGASAEARRKLLDRYKLEMKRQDYPEPGADLMTTEGDAIAAANALQESDAVDLAQPNFVHIAPKLGLDTDLDSEAEEESPAGPATGQLPMADPGFASQWNLQKISAPQAWEISQGSPSVSIAIIDEGCDMSHEDIVYMGGYDAYSGDGDPQPDGNDAHGTACAGVAAARKDNGLGGVGVAPGCRVVGIRIARGIGGGFWDTTDAKVADGIRQATDLGADVLSNSYQVGDSSVVTNAFVYAQTNGRGGRGCPIAAAAGNNDAPPVIYPARLSPTIPGFLAVSATNEWDQRKSTTSLDGETWWGSSYGPEVDVGAPGVHIYASDIMGGAGYGAGNYIPNFNGTSSATPHVAGLMGLILSVDPELRSWEVEDIIKQTADDLGPSGRDDEFGFGRINARRALEAASRIWYEITVKPVFLGSGQDLLHPGEAPDVQPGHQHRPPRRPDAQLAQPDLDQRDRPVRVPAESRQRAGAARRPRRDLRPHPAQGQRQQARLELPLVAQLGVHVLAADRTELPARRRSGRRPARHRHLGHAPGARLRRGAQRRAGQPRRRDARVRPESPPTTP